MSLIVRKLNEYHTNRSPCFIGATAFVLDDLLNPFGHFYEVVVDGQLEHYYFLGSDTPLKASAVKAGIKRRGIEQYRKDLTRSRMVQWSEGQTQILDWSNPPDRPRLAVLVPKFQGKLDFTKPALFLYVPKERRRKRTIKIPKGTGPIPFRL